MWMCLYFMLLACFFSCQSNHTEKKAQVIRVNIGSDPTSIDPRRVRELNEQILVKMLFEGLTRIDKKGEAELALASDLAVDSEGLRYRFTLREAYWTNGDRISPEDFLYSWKTNLHPEFPSENAAKLFCIKNALQVKKGECSPDVLGVRIIGENELEIELEHPIPYFLQMLALPEFVPIHKQMNLKEGECISCGPFSLKQWKHNDFLELARNPSYWDSQAVRLASLFFTMVSEDTEVRMFENGELDWAGSPMSILPVDLIPGLQKEGSLRSFGLPATAFFRMNVEEQWFHNKNIRKAFALAINRKALVDHVMQGGQEVALRLVPNPENTYFLDGDTQQSKDLARGYLKQGLEELQVERLPKISLLYASFQKNHLVAQAIQRDWKNVLGVDVALEATETKVYFDRLKRLDYQMALGSWVADFPDPENFLSVFKYKNVPTNRTGWENREYTALLENVNNQQGQMRVAHLADCEKILMEEMPIAPLYHLRGLYCKAEGLKGVEISPVGLLDFRWAYMEEEK